MKKLLIILLFIPLTLFCQENVVNSYENFKYRGNIYVYNGKPYDGVVEIYYKNGQLKEKSIFKNGLNNDISVEYYQNGQLEKKIRWRDGRYHGLCEWYYEDGDTYMMRNYMYGKKDGLHVVYRENGNLLFVRNYRDGEFDGEVKSYYENGQLSQKTLYKYGEENGLEETYYENGQLSSKANYRDGEWDGEVKSYYKNGQLKLKVYWKNGVRMDIGGVNIEDINVYDLEAMIRLFLKDCELNNIKLSSDYKITSTFGPLDDGVLALAFGIFNDEEIIIRVNPKEWSNASNPKRWYIMYHELGHDVLNLQHGQGGKMMFNYTEKDYTWGDFFKDKDYMFNSMKSK